MSCCLRALAVGALLGYVAGLREASAPPRRLALRAELSRLGSNGTGAGHGGHRTHFVRAFSLRWVEGPRGRRVTGRPAGNATAHWHNATNATARRLPPPPRALGNATNATARRPRRLPPPPRAGQVFEVDDSPDPRGAWPCLEARTSTIPNAGKGLFATVGIQNSTLLGEYLGKRFVMGDRGSSRELEADWDYIWKIPRCLAPRGKPTVITRADKHKAHDCSNDNGFVYVDAKPLVDPKKNPLRYVNGAQSQDQSQRVNVEAFFAYDRVFYYTVRDVAPGTELVVDYGNAYWKPAKKEGDRAPEEIEGDWGNFVDDDF